MFSVDVSMFVTMETVRQHGFNYRQSFQYRQLCDYVIEVARWQHPVVGARQDLLRLRLRLMTKFVRAE